MYFAEVVTIPNTVAGLLGLIITTLCGVIVWQQNRIDKCSGRYDLLQEQRLTDHKETLSQAVDVMRDDAQSNRVLAEKIDGVRGKL